jgi:transposase
VAAVNDATHFMNGHQFAA